MRTPVWAVQMAARFWEQAGGPEAFPRSLHGSIARAVPLSIVHLPRLCIEGVLEWLGRNQVSCKLEGPNRRLRACLVARNGKGFAFIDGTDGEDEQRFSLAHELAHFLRDYQVPRERVGRSVGTSVLAVLDGRREPKTDERFDALIGGVSLKPHVHLLDRTEHGEPVSAAVAEAEEAADRLAYELLAPADCLVEACRDLSPGQANTLLAERLRTEFGLPARHAEHYAELLVPSPRVDPMLLSMRQALRK